MNTKEFKKKYLSYYLLLESDFKDTFNYVSVEKNNYITYSNIYLKLLLAIGSEIDIIKKFVAKLFVPNFDEKKDNVNEIILKCFPEIKEIEIKARFNESLIKPWHYEKEPEWWTAYNEIKHNRLEDASKFDSSKKYYQYANLENVILSLSALFSLEFIAYRKLALDSNEKLFLPTVNTLFSITNLYWKDVQHGTGIVFIDGCLYMPD